MRYHVRELLGPRLQEVARQYEAHGFIIIEGLEHAITPLFHSPVARAVGLPNAAFVSFLDAESEAATLIDTAVPPLPILNWANYIDRYLRHDDGAAGHMARMVNVEQGRDRRDVYTAKYHNRPIHTATIRRAAAQLVAQSPHATYPRVNALLELWDNDRSRAASVPGGTVNA